VAKNARFPSLPILRYVIRMRKIVDDQRTVNGEVEPRAVVPRIRRAIRKDHPALVPALVALADVGEIYATLAVAAMTSIVQQMYATFVTVDHRHVPVVPAEHRIALQY